MFFIRCCFRSSSSSSSSTSFYICDLLKLNVKTSVQSVKTIPEINLDLQAKSESRRRTSTTNKQTKIHELHSHVTRYTHMHIVNSYTLYTTHERLLLLLFDNANGLNPCNAIYSKNHCQCVYWRSLSIQNSDNGNSNGNNNRSELFYFHLILYKMFILFVNIKLFIIILKVLYMNWLWVWGEQTCVFLFMFIPQHKPYGVCVCARFYTCVLK